MALMYYHPLGNDNYTITGTTYSGHGIGKLDFPGNQMPLYAMCDGVVAFCGLYSAVGGNPAVSCCAIQCEDNGLGITFYIRYLHGVYNVSVGDNVVRGQLIGYSSDVGSPGSYHLHLDFSAVPNNFYPIQGIINFQQKTFSYNNITLPLIDDVDLTQVQNWITENNDGDPNLCGFCWLVMASKLEIIEPDSPTYDSKMDVSLQMNLSESDWLAIYGMWQYEEGNIFVNEPNYEIAAAISEWVVRVFRNRLIAGTSIDNICKWNSGSPGRTKAERLGGIVNEEMRQFIRNIILGNNYFYIEKIALQYRYIENDWRSITNDLLWQRHLYAADTFYGGRSPRDFHTLAKVPFNGGPYFFMEAEFSQEVQRLWNEGGYFDYNPYFT